MADTCREQEQYSLGRVRTAQTIQASLPPSSIWMGTMPAFLQMLMPVSPPVKLQHTECFVTTTSENSLKQRNGCPGMSDGSAEN